MKPSENSGQDASVAEAPVSFYEKHRKIYIREVRGWWATWRWIFVWFTQILFYGAPWLLWNDRQAILFHLVERKFYLFGLVLWPQDVFYLAVLLIVSAYALFLFTAIAGRLFCGYACPQTVYSEIFMWIENRIEGDRSARMKLDKAPLSVRKIGLKAVKHAVWLLISLWTGFTLVAYFTPMQELLAALPFGLSGWELFWTFFYAGFCYMQAGFLREQVCKYMCPYARFQGVMFDPDTLVITYDPERGEPRGARKKGADAGNLGDCVDCGLCVVVCPTGIDIRKGIQYECIGCGACIDACDPVMDKIGKPRGLIRYTTENALAKHFGSADVLAHIMRPRIILYTAILALICVATAWSLATRVPLMVDVIRDRSVLSREADDGSIENVYNLKFMNTTELTQRYRVQVDGLPGVKLAEDQAVEVESAENHEVTVVVRVPPESGQKGANTIYFNIQAEGDEKIAVREKASFLMP
ncbi:cytochrome c oxidase accessory protein FixG [Azonexus fungiphilus]|jgi:cytochrome c oxidase accessory protein FixG|uniref:Cytochrome c oxidase accessory protein FixG n=1 Tax=Azonexus fungiphilus TaxID=146940 RepID=A0A495VRS2_9RHOO|nr:cytochrome c oxidase accessory protein CcoG [Azonexus fungiphilus]NHC07189.1 cytochrome c oxidase accessory protein CcoG [Azonexus fungiphilus]RKT50368.1 cytochrome c oxidase accessory protein FixG [Azonexus fungiphilus]